MWYAYAVGFGYAVIVGQIIHIIMVLMWDCIMLEGDSKTKSEGEHWQGAVTGVIERVLYVSSLLMGHGEFIGFWLALKVASRWKLWSEDHKGRAVYMGSLTGSALSVLYAGVGFKMITWINHKQWFSAAIVPSLLVLATGCLWAYLDRQIKKA